MNDIEKIEQGRDLAKAFSRVFSGEDGLKVMLYILQQGGVFEPAVNILDPLAIAQADARRGFAVELAHMANLGVEDFTKLLEQARNEYGYRRNSGSGNRELHHDNITWGDL